MECFMPAIIAAWNSGPAQPHIQWARNTHQALQPFAVKATYVNFMSDEEQSLVPAAYGHNYERLVALKRRFDPENVFHRNANIKP
jgi:FAD/FMN-containing dehydrogenase